MAILDIQSKKSPPTVAQMNQTQVSYDPLAAAMSISNVDEFIQSLDNLIVSSKAHQDRIVFFAASHLSKSQSTPKNYPSYRF